MSPMYFVPAFLLILLHTPLAGGVDPLIYGKYVEKKGPGAYTADINTLYFFQSPHASPSSPAPVIFHVHGG